MIDDSSSVSTPVQLRIPMFGSAPRVVATALLVGGTVRPFAYSCVGLHFESQATAATTLLLCRVQFELVQTEVVASRSQSVKMASCEICAPVTVAVGTPIELGWRAGTCSFLFRFNFRPRDKPPLLDDQSLQISHAVRVKLTMGSLLLPRTTVLWIPCSLQPWQPPDQEPPPRKRRHRRRERTH